MAEATETNLMQEDIQTFSLATTGPISDELVGVFCAAVLGVLVGFILNIHDFIPMLVGCLAGMVLLGCIAFRICRYSFSRLTILPDGVVYQHWPSVNLTLSWEDVEVIRSATPPWRSEGLRWLKLKEGFRPQLLPLDIFKGHRSGEIRALLDKHVPDTLRVDLKDILWKERLL